jgi:hypothetical protein
MRLAALLSVCLSLSGLGSSQSLTFGSLAGTLTDSAGAVIPNASVTLINQGTDDHRHVVTDANGLYQFLNLPPATYRLEAEATGFKRFVRTEIALGVNQAARVDVRMEIGAVTESVEVAASAPLLEPETSSLGQVVDGRKMRDLPLNGRNPLALVALVPAVVPQLGSQNAPAGQNPFQPGNFQIGGGAANQSQIYLDGASVNLNYGNIVALVPTQDSIAEFKVQTNSLSAEFGRTAGGVINMATRAGTNRFTGTAYEFLRNRALNANTFFNNRAGAVRPSFVQNQYGVEAAGPIKKDKLFFMANWEGFRQRVGHPLVLSVPTAAERAGDFSNLRGAKGALIPIYDPYTVCGSLGNAACAKDSNGNNIVLRQPFPGNMIPSSRLNPGALAYEKASWGLPNTTGAPFTQVNNFVGNPSGGANSDWLTLRSDLNISAKQRLFGRYSLWKSLTLEVDPFGTHAYPGELVQGSPENFTNQQVVLADTYSLSATTIVDVRVSWLRQYYNRYATSYGFDLTQLGWPSFMNSQVSARFLPAVSVQGLSSFIANTGSLILGRTEDRGLAGSLTKIVGSHALKAGGELRIGPYNYLQLAGGSGTFSFTNTFTANNPFSPAGGAGFASFLLGTGAGGNITTSQPVSAQQIYGAFYFQDDWRVSRKLTLNLGVRWDLAGPWSERFNRLSVFLPDAASPLAQSLNLPLKGKFALVDSPDNPARTNTALEKNLFAPRVGFAYQITPKTVLRSGYGIFYIPTNLVTTNDPHADVVNSAANTWVPTIDSVTPFTLFSNPFPNGLTQPAGRNPNFEQALWGTAPSMLYPNDPLGYMQQWNFGIQRELPLGIYVDAAYAGAKGTHLPVGGYQVDQLPDQLLSLGPQLSRQVPNPFYGTVKQGNLQTATVSQGQLLRPYPQFNGLTEQTVMIGTSNYESFQLKVQRRFAAGASILAAYTNAKLISDGTDSLTGFLETDGGVSAFQDFNNFRAERSLSAFDVSQRLVTSFALDLPFGSGKRYLAHLNSAASKLISGWAVEGIATFQSGFPIHVTATPNTTGSLGGGLRPNSTGQSANLGGSAQSRLNGWFNTAAFKAPAPYTFGNVGRNLPDVRSAGINNWDLAFVKNTALGHERLTLQFRAEFFNLLNRVQFGFPGQALGTPQFGVVSSQVNQPRLAQFSLRTQW